jgi:pentafunctional AROM polypeptide
MGTMGQLSCILSRTLTPIMHPLFPTKAAPGRPSFAKIQHALHLSEHLAKQFIFNNPSQHSLSPAFHNTAFYALGLPHMYGTLETTHVDDTVRAMLGARHWRHIRHDPAQDRHTSAA